MTREYIGIALVVLTALVAGIVIGYLLGGHIEISTGGISLGNAVEIGAIFAVGIGLMTFLWTLHGEMADMRERIAILEVKLDQRGGSGPP